MNKLMKLAALMREVKALIDEIENETKETGISIIDVQAKYNETFPRIQLFTGLPKVAGNAPVKREFVECQFGDYWRDEKICDGVKYIEIDADKKEGILNASVAV